MHKRTSQTQKAPTLLLVLVAILAGSVSIWTGRPLASACLDAFHLRDAVEGEAELIAIESETVSAGDGTQEQVWVTFRYSVGNESYEKRTRRVALFHPSAKYLQDLEEAMKLDERVPCYIAKSDPNLCVLSKDFSIPAFLVSALFPICFGGFAILVVVSLMRSRPA